MYFYVNLKINLKIIKKNINNNLKTCKMVKTAKSKNIKKEHMEAHQSQTSSLLMSTMELPSMSGFQKHNRKNILVKNELQEQTNVFLKNHSSESPPLIKQASPSPILSPSASSLSSYSEILSQVESQAKSEKLRRKIQELEQQLRNIKDTPTNKNCDDPKNNENHNEFHNRKDDVNDENDDMELCSKYQLFGKHWKEDEMDLLSNGIYCKKRIRAMAESCSYKASHVARRLLEGVYKREALVKYTFTGKSQGKFCGTLDQNAKNAIIDFSMNLNKNQFWQSQTVYDINRAMSQKISEIKRAYKRL